MDKTSLRALHSVLNYRYIQDYFSGVFKSIYPVQPGQGGRLGPEDWRLGGGGHSGGRQGGKGEPGSRRKDVHLNILPPAGVGERGEVTGAGAPVGAPLNILFAGGRECACIWPPAPYPAPPLPGPPDKGTGGAGEETICHI